MAFFRKSAPGDPLAVTMAGVKLGDRVLAMGMRDTTLIAALAAKSGLTGRACAVDADEARVKSAAAAIEREGALVEATRAPWGMLPYDDDSFDVVVVRDVFMILPSQARALAASGLLRVLRPGAAEEIADLIWFLASDRAGWITGETISIDGGRHLTCAR